MNNKNVYPYTILNTHIRRGDNFTNKYRITELQVGDFYEEEVIITEEQLLSYANVTGDKNPLHIDEEYASQTFFKHRIAHGMLLGGYISKIIGMDFPGEGTIYLTQDMKFVCPIYINDRITIRIEVMEKIEDKNRIVLSTNCLRQNGEMAISGKAIVLPPK